MPSLGQTKCGAGAGPFYIRSRGTLFAQLAPLQFSSSGGFFVVSRFQPRDRSEILLESSCDRGWKVSEIADC